MLRFEQPKQPAELTGGFLNTGRDVSFKSSNPSLSQNSVGILLDKFITVQFATNILGFDDQEVGMIHQDEKRYADRMAPGLLFLPY